jgi:hypothetical protein
MSEQHGPGAFPRVAGEGYYNRGLWVPGPQVASDLSNVIPPQGKFSFGVGAVGTPSPAVSSRVGGRLSAVPDFPQRSPVGSSQTVSSAAASPPSSLQELALLQEQMHALETDRARLQWQLADQAALIGRHEEATAQLVADQARMARDHQLALLAAENAALRARLDAGGVSGSVLRVVTTADRGATVAAASPTRA